MGQTANTEEQITEGGRILKLGQHVNNHDNKLQNIASNTNQHVTETINIIYLSISSIHNFVEW
jgi:hypothetical protein